MRTRIPKKLREQVIAEQGIVCHYCGVKTSTYSRQIDHKRAVTKGGTNAVNNLLVSCRTCNRRKGNKDYEVYLRWQHTITQTHLQILEQRIQGLQNE